MGSFHHIDRLATHEDMWRWFLSLIPAPHNDRRALICWSWTKTTICPSTPQGCGVSRIILLLHIGSEPAWSWIVNKHVWYLRSHRSPVTVGEEEQLGKRQQPDFVFSAWFVLQSVKAVPTSPSQAEFQPHADSAFSVFGAKHNVSPDSQLTTLIILRRGFLPKSCLITASICEIS